MSHSDSEIRDEKRHKPRTHHLINVKFKKAKQIRNQIEREEFRKLKIKLGPVLEIRLIDAVNTNNVDKVRDLLERGVSPNSADSEKRSALHVAVSKGYSQIVELLLKHGANPNSRDIIQNTPLHLAACVHNFSIVTMLINAKADVTCLDLHGRNPFQLALSKLQILRKSWNDGTIEMINLKQELKDVVDLLLSMLLRNVEQSMENMNKSDVDDLQLMKLSISSDPPEELDNQMSRLMCGIEKFTIT
ncbi:ankyrin repeat domain-containing protein 54 [Diabrotica virgifera virgifera]|uniref:Ankyrin repeat domain-containing protein 54-like n=1 Tax=Diabrotica virgifera virgifera TaxID=50390 RepID=A0A6P7FEI8_DIAVI|nr:ankyrin repeat domain-containing protein 54 [Diabrotica virgifera virgifera]